jgi:hypothetical protein
MLAPVDLAPMFPPSSSSSLWDSAVGHLPLWIGLLLLLIVLGAGVSSRARLSPPGELQLTRPHS